MIHYCKCCGKKTCCIDFCENCRMKYKLLRQIKAMLMPYYISKKEREKRNESKTR